MEKLKNISVNDNTFEVILTFENDRQVYKINDQNLLNFLNSIKSELKNDIEEIDKKMPLLNKWLRYLYISCGLFGLAFLYYIITFMGVITPSLIPLLSIIPLGVSYFKFKDYLDDNENDLVQKNQILDMLDKIEYINNYDFSLVEKETVKKEVRKERVRKEKHKNRNKVNINFEPFVKREKVSIQKDYKVKHGEKSKVDRALELSNYNDELREQFDMKMDELESRIDDFGGRGRNS